MMGRSLESIFKDAREGDVGIIGFPLDHSFSPLMQNTAFNTWWGAFRDNDERTPVYHKFPVERGEVKMALDLAQKKKLRGLNVTVPYKGEVCGLIGEIDAVARRAGSVNTLHLTGGTIKGYNTDGDGFRRSLQSDYDFEFAGKRVLVLGAGGTGRSIVQTLGAEQSRIQWWNRTSEKIPRILNDWTDLKQDIDVVQTGQELSKAASRADLIVNATSVGLNPEDGLPAPGLRFKPGQMVFDVIYHRETRFMQEAKSAGAQVIGGLGMLVYQGATSFEIWTGAPAPKEAMWAALSTSMKKEKEN